MAAAYRDRFAGIQNRFEDLSRHEEDLVARLDTSDQTFVVVTLVPDLAGGFTLDAKAMHDFQQEVIGRDPLILPQRIYWQRITVGSRRLVADGTLNTGPAKWLACELHESGAGSFAAVAAQRKQDESVSQLDDEVLANNVWSGLRFLARHARDRAAAGGHATVRASILPVSEGLPAQLVQHRPFGIPHALGRQQVITPPVSTSVFDIDDLAEDGPPLIAATSVVITGLIQHFGYPEVLQMSRDGKFRIKYWRQPFAQQVQAWATEAGVDVSDHTIS